MKVTKLQATLAVIVVTIFTLVTAIMALAPLIGVDSTTSLEHLKAFSSIYGGIVGIIIGYFFGKQSAGGQAAGQ